MASEVLNIISSIWTALGVIAVAGGGLVAIADVDAMSEDQLDDLLEKSALDGWQKKELKTTRDKTRYYSDAVMWQKLNDSDVAYTNFNEYLSKNGIFIPEPVKAKFAELNELLLGAFMERRLSMQFPKLPPKFDKGAILHETGPKLLKALEQEVQGRLWNSTRFDNEPITTA
jgi:hypothetical protein